MNVFGVPAGEHRFEAFLLAGGDAICDPATLGGQYDQNAAVVLGVRHEANQAFMFKPLNYFSLRLRVLFPAVPRGLSYAVHRAGPVGLPPKSWARLSRENPHLP